MAEIIISILYVLIFLFLIRKMPLFRSESISVKTFQLLFLVKIAAAVLLYIIYTKFYPDRSHADIFRYYDDSLIMFNAAFIKPMEFLRMLTGIHANTDDLWHYYDEMHNWFNSEMVFNDSRTMIRINALMRFVSFGTYFPHAVMMSFLGMLGLTGIYKIFISLLPRREFILIILVYLLPSTLLWSSGMIKEAFLIFSIGMLLYIIHVCLRDRKFNLLRITGIFFFSFALLCIKSYVLFAILPGIITWIACLIWKLNKPLTAFIIHTTYLLILFNVSSVFTYHTVPELLSAKQNEFYRVADVEGAKSIIRLPPLEGTTGSLLKNIPGAFFVTLLRPYLGETKNPLMLIAALENAIIFLFIIICLSGMKGNKNESLSSVFYLAICFSLIMYVLIGLVTPILGAIVRYKIPSLTFLLFSFFCLTHKKWVYYYPVKLKEILFHR